MSVLSIKTAASAPFAKCKACIKDIDKFIACVHVRVRVRVRVRDIVAHFHKGAREMGREEQEKR